MARLARVAVPGYCYHVTHKGNRRARIFFEAEDREHLWAAVRYVELNPVRAAACGCVYTKLFRLLWADSCCEKFWHSWETIAARSAGAKRFGVRKLAFAFPEATRKCPLSEVIRHVKLINLERQHRPAKSL
ncbi:MAG: hypothetical protein ACR2IE_19340 [Candidatus Sumerlaeaceae bacterium]